MPSLDHPEADIIRFFNGYRLSLQKRRLLADIVEPAEAARKAAELRARAEAAPILENGKARVEVLRLLYSQISAVEAVKGIDIDRLVVMDSGSGDGVANAANQRINAAYKTLEGLGSALGIDIQQLLQNASRRVDGGSTRPVIRDAGTTDARSDVL